MSAFHKSKRIVNYRVQLQTENSPVLWFNQEFHICICSKITIFLSNNTMYRIVKLKIH